MKNIIPLIIILSFSKSFAQNKFAVANIPKILTTNADAVERINETELSIEGPDKIITKKHWAVTIFNENGEENYSTFRAYYDKFTKIKHIEGTIYDKNGNKLKELKKSDIEDFGYGSFGNTISDDRVKIARFDKKFYERPYTLEFNYEEESSNTLFYPEFYPISSSNVGIEFSKFSIKAKKGTSYRKKEINLIFPSIKFFDEKYTYETWEVRNLVPQELEEFSKNENLIKVLLGPTNFNIDKNYGSIKSFTDISTYMYQLNSDRDKLPNNKIAELKQQITDLNSPIEKIKKAYEFMQKETRYANVSLGVGGWQTKTAEDVAESGYGDCKALSNYMVALLKSIGIKAYSALVLSGPSETFDNLDFPRAEFTHVIVCVPMPKDSIWLECTSQSLPFDYLGSFTGNKYALLLKNQNGSLVKTKTYNSEENLKQKNIEIKINDKGISKILFKGIYSGIQQQNIVSKYEENNDIEINKWLNERFDLSNFEILSRSYKIIKDKIPKLEENIEISTNKYGTTTGNRLFLKPNQFTKFIASPVNTNERKTKLYLNPNFYTFKNTDVVTIAMPSNFKIEYLPKDIEIANVFGVFKVNYKFENNTLTYTRLVNITGGEFEKEDYEKWLEFIKNVNNSDAQKAVFVKN